MSVCAPQLYTQLTVILDDPDFPRLTLSVSQLSHSNLSFSPFLSIYHTQICRPCCRVYTKSGNTWKHAYAYHTCACREKKEIKAFNAHLPICHMHFFFFRLSAIMKHGKQGGNWLQRSTVEQKGLKHRDESQHTTTTCSINTAHTYLWVMEADTRLDWHVLVWALRSPLRPTANKEREHYPQLSSKFLFILYSPPNIF